MRARRLSHTIAVMHLDYKAELNGEQYRAATLIEGPILIIAGAGSGKTRVITFRMAYMLEKGIPQSQILALTFTNKAAREMESRVKELTGRKLQNLTVSTFHAFGVRILRQDIERLGWRSNFSIYDETDRSQLIKETARECGLAAESLDLYALGTLFSNVKTGCWQWGSTANEQYRALYDEYQRGLKIYNAVDFDDLITLPIRLFREFPDLLAAYRERYKYIMVDEFQDTSIQQYEFMRLLAGSNVAVVGDDDQSIYSWRGANYENIRMFERDFPNVTEIRLEQNYRSTETILAAANGVISHNTNRKDKSLWSGNGSGKPIEIYMPENEAEEADFIAECIQSICMEEKRRYDDFGVLMRANTQGRAIEEAFLEANIPYVMSGGSSFFERKEIKDIISYLRVCANHDDDINLLRIINTPRRGIGRKTIEDIGAAAKALDCPLWTAMQVLVHAHRDLLDTDTLFDEPVGGAKREPPVLPEHAFDIPLPEINAAALQAMHDFIELITAQRSALLGGKGLSKKVRAFVDEIHYSEYLIGEYQKNEKAARFKFLNIEHLIDSIEMWENNPDNFEPTLFNWLNRVTLLSRDDMDDEALRGKVNLMTIHASKGLEFPVVFIPGAEEGLIPHARSLEDGEENIEEERRLFYVAITRAQDKLFISSCRRRKRMQAVCECEPSRFLDEIPQQLVEYHEPLHALEEGKVLDILSRMKLSLGRA